QTDAGTVGGADEVDQAGRLLVRRRAMPFIETRYEHVILDDRQVPIIAGTTMKVIELVQAQLANGWSAEELQAQFPYLSLGQIHSALAYYWDHKEELDQDIARRLQWADEMQQAAA